MPGLPRTAMETRLLLPGAATASLVAGGVLELAGAHDLAASAIWAASTLALLIPLTIAVGRSLLHGDVGVDAIALLAMAGALALGEYLAGAVIALMLAGGNALELFAQGRARRELTLLVDRAPKWANRIDGEAVERIGVEQVQIGDRLLVRAGEVIPTDGVVLSAEAIVDDSALTGEPLPRTLHAGATARGGCTNAGEAFELEAATPASGSAYAALVRLVRDAERSQAPFVRMADRYAAVFLPADARRGRLGVGDERQPSAGRRSAGRCDAVPADPGGADRVHRGRLPRGARGRDREGRRRHRGAGPGAHRALRQDRDADAGDGARRPDPDHRRCAGRRGAADRGVARPVLLARHGRGARPGGVGLADSG